MPYNKRNWASDVPLSVANLEAMDEGIYQNSIRKPIVEVSTFDDATDPNILYKISFSTGAQYFVLVIKDDENITQWRFSPRSPSNVQLPNIHIRYGQVETAGTNETITWGPWTSLAAALELASTSDIPDVSGKADKATTLAGYGISDAYTKNQVDAKIPDISGKADKAETYTKTQVDNIVSGKVNKDQKIAGIALSSDISKDDLVDNIHSKINPANVVSGQTNGYLGQYGSTADKKPMFYTGMSNWAELAKASDIPDVSGKADKATTLAGYGITNAYTKTEVNTALSGKADTADIPENLNDLLDGATAMRRYTGSSAPPTGDVAASQMVAVPCIWYYDGDAWLIYGKEAGTTAGYYKYKMIQFATDDDLPDLTTKEDKSNKVEQVQDSSSTIQYPSIKAMTTYVTLGLSHKEATANRVTSINASSDNSHYPTAKAVYDYVNGALGDIETALSEV